MAQIGTTAIAIRKSQPIIGVFAIRQELRLRRLPGLQQGLVGSSLVSSFFPFRACLAHRDNVAVFRDYL